jgi:hypothetical protein
VSEPTPLLDRKGIEEAFRRLGDRRYDLEAEKDRLGAELDGIRPLSAAS